ncbi:peroxisome proliferator-activated receptor gamma coactivator-related protein 1-like isoform X2 [Mugil cephalus]|uniref:peroxisome proliferator-activated receptor gamma coactivator-related protein 1-like isoform X2 n=1 Tax=Mugil cephalus TaxID=48193 RepID=UPI001FB6792D|nr:peroxisome proliferator-activated receptor gamma coactivator-related protein 1-like isoform X2 [Mugil cephalus]
MWRSKMAARWMRKDEVLNAGNSDFLASNTPNELILSAGGVGGVDMDTQSCVDRSILAIFEDSTVASEGKMGMEEESESLLSALTEMLDSVEDDDATLSPFDTLPDTNLLSHTEHRDNSVEPSLTHRLRQRPKPPNVTFKVKSEGESDQECMELCLPNIKKAEAEVEVFTSTSLANLVKIMHSYCLKLHVEEGDKLRKKHTIFSQEEVWKYEHPTEESDEEINVVSDDETPVKKTKEEAIAGGRGDNGHLLKSVLLNGNSSRPPPPREKKRVSFGPVQVALFDESVENGLNEDILTSGHMSETESVNSMKALEKPDDSALEPPTLSSEMSHNEPEVQALKAETKTKSLSLQQYRQLRQKRQPLVETQGKYTTKWPSVSVPPKELTPILCLENSCRPKTTDHYTDVHKPHHKTSSRCASLPARSPEAATCLRRSGLKRSRTESKLISPVSPLPGGATANLNDTVPESKRSPVKKVTLLSSDPPNPVLVPLPVLQTASTADSSSEPTVEFLSRNLKQIEDKSSAAAPQRQTSEPKTRVSLPNKDFTPSCTTLHPKAILTTIPPGASCITAAQTQSASDSVKPPKTPDTVTPKVYPPSAQHCSQPSSPVDGPILVTKEELPDVSPSDRPSEKPAALQTSCRGQSLTADSGIEAPDLTSLLEQFEETQAKEERVCEDKPHAPLPANQQTHRLSDLDRILPAGPEKTSRILQTCSVDPLESLSTSQSPGTQKAVRNLPGFQTLEGVDIPEPLCTEIILSTQQEQPSRRRNPPPKAIQIIDPRPLPSKKIQTSLSESPAAQYSPHIYSYISSDHDYCGSVDYSPLTSSQRSRAKTSFKEIPKTTAEPQVTTQDSAGEGKKQNPAGLTKSVPLQHSEEPRMRTEAEQSTNKALQFSHTGDDGPNENGAAPCGPPTPPPSPPFRGRDRRRYWRRSPRSDSSSSSCSSSSSSSSSSASRSPKRPRLHHKRSESSSCSSSSSYSRSPPRRYRSSRSRSGYSRSRSRSWSRSMSPSQSRSPSPQICHRRWRDVCSREARKLRREQKIRIQKLKAIDERRVVYVGRISRSMTHEELRDRFTQFGEVECVSLHFRDRGDHYGFVTFYNMEDAFAAIDNGGKLRKPNELPFDICFGGRRQFCNTDYADLDANRDAELTPPKSRCQDLDFDSLLKQAQRGLKR